MKITLHSAEYRGRNADRSSQLDDAQAAEMLIFENAENDRREVIELEASPGSSAVLVRGTVYTVTGELSKAWILSPNTGRHFAKSVVVFKSAVPASAAPAKPEAMRAVS